MAKTCVLQAELTEKYDDGSGAPARILAEADGVSLSAYVPPEFAKKLEAGKKIRIEISIE